MADPVLEAESSEQGLVISEVITIAYGTTRHRITFADRDIPWGGNIYISTPGTRGEIDVPTVDNDKAEMTLTLVVDHPFVRRYLRMLVPPNLITVTIVRLYESGASEQIWIGEVTSMAVSDDNTTATFRVPSRAGEAAQRMLPTLSVGRSCPYILYGAGCAVSRSGSGPTGLAYKVTTTPIGVSGREVRVDLGSTDRLGSWAVGGELVHVASGERMSIAAQDDLNPPFSSVTRLTLQLPIPDLKISDTVEIYAGCDHSIDGSEGCGPKFDNRQNFGGYPSLPTNNPFKWER